MSQETATRIRKIVSVDDDSAMIDLFKHILKRDGFEVLGAQTGTEGLELIASAKPDLVLLDLMMPEMDGWEVYKALKADEIMRAIPVIVVTCKAQPIDEILARSIAKVDDYISKPFIAGRLTESVNKVLSRSAGASHL